MRRATSLFVMMSLLCACGAETAEREPPIVAALNYNRVPPAPDAPFRASPPAVPSVAERSAPPLHRSTLSNGLRVIVVERHDLPIVSAGLLIDRGEADLAGNTRTAAHYLASFSSAATANRSRAELAAALDTIGGQGGMGVGPLFVSASLKVASGDLDTALEWMADVTTHPRLAAEDLEPMRRTWLSAATAAQTGIERTFAGKIAPAFYGAEHPLAVSAVPIAQIKSITRDDFVAAHAALMQPARATLVVVGDVSPDVVDASAERLFGAWRATAAEPAPLPAPAIRSFTPKIVLVNRANDMQVHARIAARGPDAASDEADAFALAAKLLGGLSSRLRGEVREEQGAAYSIGASWSANRSGSLLTIDAVLDTSRSPAALERMIAAVRSLCQHGPTADDLEVARASLLAEWRARTARVDQLAYFIVEAVSTGQPPDRFADFPARIRAITANDVRRVAQKYLADGRLAVVVLGDAKRIAEPLQKIDFGPVERVEGALANASMSPTQ